ncbi:MAG: outer membrane beta-barrel protein [Saprospiraceae bacterium]|nr:outer membrane beta-barrel protein [Saprospiraceae bacterium]
MYKILLSIAIVAISLTSVQAQYTKIKKGDLDIAAGIGLVPTFAADRGNTIVPPASVRLDYRVTKQFTLGAYAAFSSTESNIITQPNGSVERFETDYTIVGIRAAAHGNPRDNWDVYGGFLIGYNMPSVNHIIITPATDIKNTEDQPSFTRPAKNQMTYSGFVGAAYYVKKNIGVFAELGYGISLLNAGVQIKL